MAQLAASMITTRHRNRIGRDRVIFISSIFVGSGTVSTISRKRMGRRPPAQLSCTLATTHPLPRDSTNCPFSAGLLRALLKISARGEEVFKLSAVGKSNTLINGIACGSLRQDIYTEGVHEILERLRRKEESSRKMPRTSEKSSHP